MNRTNLVVGVGIILCAASLIWLEGRFSSSDHRKARKLVRTYMVEHRRETFEQFLMAQHDGQAGQWDSEVTDNCRGVVRVQWYLPGDPPVIYLWDVNVSTKEIFAVPESPAGKHMLELFHEEPEPLPPLELPSGEGRESETDGAP